MSRYQPSVRTLPQTLPDIAYSPDDHVIIVGWDGAVKFAKQKIKVSNALQHLLIALRVNPGKDGPILYFSATNALAVLTCRIINERRKLSPMSSYVGYLCLRSVQISICPLPMIAGVIFTGRPSDIIRRLRIGSRIPGVKNAST